MFYMFFLATGCTSDKDDTQDSSDTLPADTVAPVALSSTPFDGEREVAVNRTVNILFSEPLNPSSVTTDTFTLMADGTLVAGTVSFAGSTATFTPTESLMVSTLFDASVSNGMVDLAGNPLATAFSWQFTSGELADTSAPVVLSTRPSDTEIDVAIDRTIDVLFSEPLNPSSINTDTFTLMANGIPIPGAVTFAGSTATFTSTDNLTASTLFDVALSTDLMDLAGNPLTDAHTWSFTTGNIEEPGLPVDLGTAGDFVILAKSGISTVPTSAITGDIGISPAAATFITGFSLTADATNVFSTSPQITGKAYAANYAPPTPSNLTTAVGDMMLAFTDAAGRPPDFTELGAGNIGGMTLSPGVYKWGTGVLIPADVTLNGSATDIWIFEIAQDLTMSSGTNIFLTGGALPKNVFWQVTGSVTLGTTAHCEGIILTQTSATLRTGTSLNGRLLAQTAVSIDASTIVAPAE